MQCKAVRFNRYGGPEVLELVDVELPEPAEGEVLVRIRAAGLNPGETKIRTGELEAMFPTTFPSGEGSDLTGTVAAVGSGVTTVGVGDDVVVGPTCGPATPRRPWSRPARSSPSRRSSGGRWRGRSP